MRGLTFQISSQNETNRPLRDLDQERGKFAPAVAAVAEEEEYCSRVLVSRQRGSISKMFGQRLR